MEQVFVLHVGREPVLLETRGQILKDAGYVVIPALSLEDALAKLATRHFDLVLLCHSMPGHEREIFARLVHKHRWPTPVVLVSETPIASLVAYDATIENDAEKLLVELPNVLAKSKTCVRAMPSG